MKKSIKYFMLIPTIMILFGCSEKATTKKITSKTTTSSNTTSSKTTTSKKTTKDNRTTRGYVTEYRRCGEYREIGHYPQSLETDTDILDSLSAYATNLPSSSELNGWNDYHYYNKNEIESYMFYKDVDLDHDSSYDYRGVYFIKYRPDWTTWECGETKGHQKQNGYEIENVYWFKYEPIKWEIIKKDNGKMMLVSDLILDNHEFYPSDSNELFVHNGDNGYANNYKLSSIRKWLIETFYDTSFNDSEKELLQANYFNYSSYTDGDYASYGQLDDKVFLLSRGEVNLVGGVQDRKTKVTDYANIQGIQGYTEDDKKYGYWWTREACGINASCDWYVSGDTGKYSITLAGTYTTLGVKPVIFINE